MDLLIYSKSADDKLRSKKSLLSGRVVKKKKKVLGGKGCSHAIRKPSKKAIQKRIKEREEKLKKERLARIKESRKEASRSIIKSATSGTVNNSILTLFLIENR